MFVMIGIRGVNVNGKLDLYRMFIVVAQNNSFSKAAEELYMTQSAVSQAISRLEKELEIQLFHRIPKGVILTPEGSLLYEHVRSALNLISSAEDKIQEFKDLKTGQLRIAVGDTISRYYLIPYLEQFHNAYPGIKLKIWNGTTHEIVDYIKTGKADVGFCNLPIQDKQLKIIPCKEIQDVFVCGEKYKHLAQRPLQLEELLEMPLIFLENKSNSRRYVESFFKERGFPLAPVFELGSHDLVVEFAKINMGISCVTREFSLEYLERGDLYEVALEEPIPKRSIGICSLKNVPLSRAGERFIENIQTL